MSVSVSYGFRMSTQETLETGVDGISRPTLQHSALDVSGRLTASSTPVATKCSFDTIPLVAGAATIDLTALTGPGGSSVTLTGLKPQLVRIRNNGANAMTFATGASNGYDFWSSWTLIVPPGGIIQMFLNDSPEDIDATHKTIDVTGTLVQTFDFSIVAG